MSDLHSHASLHTPMAYRVEEFCAAHKISKGHLYTLFREGQGPRVIRVGHGRKAKLLIPVEAAEEWRREQMKPHRQEENEA